jgi:hypothetical protein
MTDLSHHSQDMLQRLVPKLTHESDGSDGVCTRQAIIEVQMDGKCTNTVNFG